MPVDAALHSSVSHAWETPETVLDRVRLVGPIELDPCSTDANPTGAISVFTPETDGLKQSWDCDGLVFVNPPYGRELPVWVKKCASEAKEGAEIILLAPSRTDTKWFRWASQTAVARVFWHGRLTFRDAPAPAPFPSALWYYGGRARRFRDAFASAGEVNVL